MIVSVITIHPEWNEMNWHSHHPAYMRWSFLFNVLKLVWRNDLHLHNNKYTLRVVDGSFDGFWDVWWTRRGTSSFWFPFPRISRQMIINVWVAKAGPKLSHSYDWHGMQARFFTKYWFWYYLRWSSPENGKNRICPLLPLSCRLNHQPNPFKLYGKISSV